ncbi:uncharacterized protein LOC111137598 isoform X2 [Crassostrea virginica]
MLAILLFGIFIVQFRPLQPFTISPDNLNICMQLDGTMTCCTSYYQTQDGCIPCIGATGFNCSTPCPDNYFGTKCMDRCQCSTDECDKELGCYKDYQTTTNNDDTEIQPPSTLHRNLNDDSFPKKSQLVWILVSCGTFVTILLFLIIVFLKVEIRVERVWGGFRNQRTAVGKVFKYKAGQAPEKLTQLKAKSGKGVLDPEGIQKSPQLMSQPSDEESGNEEFNTSVQQEASSSVCMVEQPF